MITGFPDLLFYDVDKELEPNELSRHANAHACPRAKLQKGYEVIMTKN